jgi:hypothetical protein
VAEVSAKHRHRNVSCKKSVNFFELENRRQQQGNTCGRRFRRVDAQHRGCIIAEAAEPVPDVAAKLHADVQIAAHTSWYYARYGIEGLPLRAVAAPAAYKNIRKVRFHKIC